ncbi:MAG: hypothetical protein QXT86_10495 [Archaeoglobaceae archaeon]
MPAKSLLRRIIEDGIVILKFNKEGKGDRIYFPADEFSQYYGTREYDEFVFEDLIVFIFDQQILERFRDLIFNPKFEQLLSSKRRKVLQVYHKRKTKDDMKFNLYYYFIIPRTWKQKLSGDDFFMLMSKEIFLGGPSKEYLWDFYKKLTEKSNN